MRVLMIRIMEVIEKGIIVDAFESNLSLLIKNKELLVRKKVNHRLRIRHTSLNQSHPLLNGLI